MSMMGSFSLSFFPRDVLDKILDLIESVSEGFPTYTLIKIKQEAHGPHRSPELTAVNMYM